MYSEQSFAIEQGPPSMNDEGFTGATCSCLQASASAAYTCCHNTMLPLPIEPLRDTFLHSRVEDDILETSIESSEAGARMALLSTEARQSPAAMATQAHLRHYTGPTGPPDVLAEGQRQSPLLLLEQPPNAFLVHDHSNSASAILPLSNEQQSNVHQVSQNSSQPQWFQLYSWPCGPHLSSNQIDGPLKQLRSLTAESSLFRDGIFGNCSPLPHVAQPQAHSGGSQPRNALQHNTSELFCGTFACQSALQAAAPHTTCNVLASQNVLNHFFPVGADTGLHKTWIDSQLHQIGGAANSLSHLLPPECLPTMSSARFPASLEAFELAEASKALDEMLETSQSADSSSINSEAPGPHDQDQYQLLQSSLVTPMRGTRSELLPPQEPGFQLRARWNPSVNTNDGPFGTSTTGCLSIGADLEPTFLIPRESSLDTVLVLDREDAILWSCDSIRICHDMVASGFIVNVDDTGRGLYRTSGIRQWKFSDLIVNEQEIWWRQACREIWLAHDQLQRCESDEKGSSALSVRCSKEMVLLWRGREEGSDQLIEVAIVAIDAEQWGEDGSLLVRIRPFKIAAVATIATQPVLADLDARSRPTPSRFLLSPAAQAQAEMRLSVSRHGLVLRVSFPSQLTARSDVGERATYAILGDGASKPSSGQNLVDMPKLASLSHVVAQAAVIGLAQTVQLKAAGRKVTVVVQPILRTPSRGSMGSCRPLQPAAKVWVSLSAAATSGRRSQSISAVTSLELGGASSEQSYLRPPVHRHHEQAYQGPDCMSTDSRSTPASRAARRASTASLYLRAALAQATAKRRRSTESFASSDTQSCAAGLSQDQRVDSSTEVADHLSSLVAQLQVENSALRREIRTCWQQWHADC